jgi:hypothetical protein
MLISKLGLEDEKICLNYCSHLPPFCFDIAEQKSFVADTLPKVLVINSFDVSSIQARKNKKELFKELTDSLELYLKNDISAWFGSETTVIPSLVQQITDSAVQDLMVKNNAGNAIVIRSLNVYFNEAAEKHTEEYGSSPKIETTYDLCSKVDYTFYNINSSSKQSQVNHCEYFTTRSMNDKAIVIKFGPDIVGKKKHTYGAVEKNAENYILSIASLLRPGTN